MITNETNNTLHAGSRGITINPAYGQTADIHGMSHGMPNSGYAAWQVLPNGTPVRALPQSYSVDPYTGAVYGVTNHGALPQGFGPSAIPYGLNPSPVHNFAPVTPAFPTMGLPQTLPGNWNDAHTTAGFTVSPSSSMPGRRIAADGLDRPAVFCPAICVTENTVSFCVTCELPGVADKDIDVIWNNGTLAIRGQKRSRHLETGSEVCVSDQICGQFYRAVSLPHVADCIDTNKITTKCVNGVLEVTLPKVRQSTDSYIKVGSNK